MQGFVLFLTFETTANTLRKDLEKLRTYEGLTLTSRQLQAIETKRKIYETAMKLADLNGFNNLKVTELCKHAHISPGTFYYYYTSIDDVFQETYTAFDEYMKEEIRTLDPDDPVFDRILQLFTIDFNYVSRHGVGLIVRQYSGLFSQIPGSNNVFYSKKRIMYKSLVSLISEGQKAGLMSLEGTPSQAASSLMIYARGITIDWALHNGSYDIVTGGEIYMRLALKHIFI